MTTDLALHLWYEALDSPRGIAIETEDRRLLTATLYNARKAHDDEDLREVLLVQNPNENEVWLVRKDVKI